jgi:NAD(P)-dependent dehydrogenase (short-subunit alcohol dehydrogenase family)
VAVHFAREGADVAILYLDEHKDADEVVELVKKEGRKCLKFSGDVSKPEVGAGFCVVVMVSYICLDVVCWSVCGGCWRWSVRHVAASADR